MRKVKYLLIFLFFALLTVLFTYPLILSLDRSVLLGYGDNVYFVWLIRWYQRAILEGQGTFFFNSWMNFPEGWNLSTTDTTLATAILGVPFSYLFGPIAGYNLAMMLTFVLSGFFMYLFAADLTKSDAAGLVAGALFAFCPYRMAHFLAGHLNLCGTHWFPLYFWGLYRLLRQDQKLDWKFVLLTSISLGGIAFTSMYYLYMTLMMTLVFGLVYLLCTRFKALRAKVFWVNSLAAVILCLPFLYYSIRPFMQLSKTGIIDSRSIEYVSEYAASPTDFIFPAADHFLFGALTGKFLDRSMWIEASLYVSLTGLALGVLAVIISKKSQHRPLIISALSVILLSVILALGINLHWNNSSVVWQIPANLQSLFGGAAETLIYLPSCWLFNHLPFFSSMRALPRFGVFALIFMPVLAAIGFEWLAQKFAARRKYILLVGALALILFEFYPGPYAELMTQPEPREVDLWLGEQQDEGAVVQMPFSESVEPAQIYYSMFFNKPMVGGFFNANHPLQYESIQPAMEKFPDEESVQWLRDLMVKYIVVDSGAYADFPAVQQRMEELGLTLLTQQDDQYVYTLAGEE